MALTTDERRRASEELHANLLLAGVTEAHLRGDTGLDEHEFREAMHVSTRSRPEHVRLLRDRLVVLVHAAGKQPAPFTVLAEGERTPMPPRCPLR